jgi:hypothetical protein
LKEPLAKKLDGPKNQSGHGGEEKDTGPNCEFTLTHSPNRAINNTGHKIVFLVQYFKC